MRDKENARLWLLPHSVASHLKRDEDKGRAKVKKGKGKGPRTFESRYTRPETGFPALRQVHWRGRQLRALPNSDDRVSRSFDKGFEDSGRLE